MTKAWRKKPDKFVRAEDIEQVVTDEVEGKIVRNTHIGGVILPKLNGCRARESQVPVPDQEKE